ncbi:MAG: helicase HerA domain-containing protein [Desulfurococcaceae archaeon]
MIEVGLVAGWENELVDVAISRDYYPSFGDLLYVIDAVGVKRIIVMEVVGMSSQGPRHFAKLSTSSMTTLIESSSFAKAKLFLEIKFSENGNVEISKAARPPRMGLPVYLVRRGDYDSEDIVGYISKYSVRPGGGNWVGLFVLRSGVAHDKSAELERHFMNAVFRVDLRRTLAKHVLITGQTGSGKTTGLKGWLIRYAMESTEKTGWLIIDRHGEYIPPEGYVRNDFSGLLVDAIRVNPSLSGSMVRSYRFTVSMSNSVEVASIPGVLDTYQGAITAKSISFTDFAGLEEVGKKAWQVEEFINVVLEAIKTLEQPVSLAPAQLVKKQLVKLINTDELAISDSADGATGNMLALIPLLADNLVIYEGVGLPREEKTGLHKLLLDRGIDARTTRMLRRLVLSIMNWSTKIVSLGGKQIVVLDDSKSVIKVSPTLKNPALLACILGALSSAFQQILRGGKSGQAMYPWEGLCSEREAVLEPETGVDLSEIVESVDKGDIVVLDVSQLTPAQADLVSLTLTRRLFEKRLSEGVEVSRGKSVIAIVSEEAPLYLSPERVSSPFNPFARVAREGRKFNVGLVAITQLATMIEKQLLANFNTLVVLRTRSSADLSFYNDIGLPVETLPYLGDRECFIYSPDLPIKEPIPAYIPAWFDLKEQVEEAIVNKRIEAKAPRELVEDVE